MYNLDAQSSGLGCFFLSGEVSGTVGPSDFAKWLMRMPTITTLAQMHERLDIGQEAFKGFPFASVNAGIKQVKGSKFHNGDHARQFPQPGISRIFYGPKDLQRRQKSNKRSHPNVYGVCGLYTLHGWHRLMLNLGDP